MRLTLQPVRKAKLDMLPLMDCMFLLLVFFIYALLSMVMHQGVPVSLPNAASAIVNQETYTSITITKNGDYYLNKEWVSIGVLTQHLEALKTNETDPNIYINADKQAQHGWVVSLLDICRTLNLNKISFETSGEIDDNIPQN